jgi:hypothetical protein
MNNHYSVRRAGKEHIMTGKTHETRGKAVWIKGAAMGALALGVLGVASCGSSSPRGVYYTDGYYGGGGGVYYQETYRPAQRHYHRGHARGYYDRHGHWRRY